MPSKLGWAAAAAILAASLTVLGGCAAPLAGTDRVADYAGAPRVVDSDYDALFTDIDAAAFTTWKAGRVVDENGNYIRISRIDVVDQNGFDHQGIVVVCEGSEDFTQAYETYVQQLTEHYSDSMGVVAGYRNAAVRGYRTYRDMDVEFFCIQDVTFTDNDGILRAAAVIALDGGDDFVAWEADPYSAFIDAYFGEAHDTAIDKPAAVV